MDLSRQTDIINGENLRMQKILIVGSGSIGSYTCLALSKMGAENITMIDFDTVEAHNIPNQFFRIEDIGKTKVEALAEEIMGLTGTMLTCNTTKFDEKHVAELNKDDGAIIIAAADNMAVRKEIYDSVVKHQNVKRYIDGRMASLSVEIFNINPAVEEDRKLYEGKLFTDEEGADIACTARGIVFPVMTCASIITNMVKQYVSEQDMSRHIIVDYSKDFFVTER